MNSRTYMAIEITIPKVVKNSKLQSKQLISVNFKSLVKEAQEEIAKPFSINSMAVDSQ